MSRRPILTDGSEDFDAGYQATLPQHPVTLSHLQSLIAGIVSAEAPTITSTTMPSGVVGAFYEFTPTATGNPAPTWSVSSGPNIGGLTWDTSTGKIQMIVPAAGTYVISFTADNGVIPADTQDITFTAISSATNAAITSSTLDDVHVGQTPVVGYFVGVTCSGTGPYQFEITSGAAPSGMALSTDTFSDPTAGIFFGTPDTAGAGSSISIRVKGASGVWSSATVFASGITVYQFPALSTTSLPDLASNTTITTAHNLVTTGYPAVANLSVSGGPSGISWGTTGTASGAGVGFANAGGHTLTITASTSCGSFGTKNINTTLPLTVYVKLPAATVYAWDPTQGKTFTSGTTVGTWAAVSGSADLTPAAYDSAFSTSSSVGPTYDDTNKWLLHDADGERLGHNSLTVSVPHHIGVSFYAPSNETTGTAKSFCADSGFSPSLQYVDNGSSLHYFRYAAGGIAITSNTAGVTRGAWNYCQGWTSSTTNIGLKLNSDTEVTSTGASGATSISKLGLMHNSLESRIGRVWIGNAVEDRDWVKAWLADTYIPTQVPNPSPSSASIIYPASSSTMQGGAFKIKVDRGTAPRTGTTGCEIYEDGVLVYTYPGDGGSDGLDWDTYIHHAAPGTRSYYAKVKNPATGDTTTATITSVTVPALSNGTYSGAIFVQHMHQSGGGTGRLRRALSELDNPYNAVLTSGKICGVIMNIEWKDYETAQGVYTMNNILANCDYCNARGTKLGICIFHVSYFGGTTDTSSVPVYIRDGSTSTYGVGYTGAGNVTNGKAGVSGRSAGGSTPHYWEPNVMNSWKLWIDYLSSQLMPGGIPYPGFYCIDMNESTWAVQSNNNANATLINAYGGNQGYGYGNQLIYYDMLKYVRSKFPGIPVFPGYNGPDASGSTTVMYGAMDRARNDGFPWTGVRDSIMQKTAPFQNYGQWSEPLATAYDAYWPPTERMSIAHVEASAPIGPSGDRTVDHWEDLADQMPVKYGWRFISWGLTDNSTYPSTNWTSTQAWSASQYLRDRTTVPDWKTNP